jgi:hypothetical protein
MMEGPFYDSNNNRPTTQARVRNWEQVDKLSAMADIGRKGRLKSKIALEKQAMEQHEDDDWFANRNRQKNRTTRSLHQQIPSNLVRDNDRYTPRLIDRIQMQAPTRQDSGSKRRSYTKDSCVDMTSLEDRNQPMPSHRRRDCGPRFRGTYGK